MHTAIGDPEVGVPKTFRSVTAATRKGLPVWISRPVKSGFSLHVLRATYGSANLK